MYHAGLQWYSTVSPLASAPGARARLARTPAGRNFPGVDEFSSAVDVGFCDDVILEGDVVAAATGQQPLLIAQCTGVAHVLANVPRIAPKGRRASVTRNALLQFHEIKMKNHKQVTEEECSKVRQNTRYHIIIHTT